MLWTDLAGPSRNVCSFSRHDAAGPGRASHFSCHVETLAARDTLPDMLPTTLAGQSLSSPALAMPHWSEISGPGTVRSVVAASSRLREGITVRVAHGGGTSSSVLYRCAAINSLQFTRGDAYL